MRILVVEDEPGIALGLEDDLKMEGYEVEHAIDGVVGYSTATAEHPDLIITDIQMPRMNGIEMIRRIREASDMQKTPIIVMSAYGKRVIDDAMEAGADDFVEKPIDFDKFLSTIKAKLPAV